MGPAETEKSFALIDSYTEPSEESAIVSKLIQQDMPVFRRNFPLQAAMEIIDERNKLNAVGAMKWWIRKWDRDQILIGDRPLLAYPRQLYPCGMALDDRDCLIVLPISPDAVFFACANPKTRTKMRQTPLSRLANLVNQETIFRAADCVYARDGSHAAFISARLEGKLRGTWHPDRE
jgi:hypothetical protein